MPVGLRANPILPDAATMIKTGEGLGFRLVQTMTRDTGTSRAPNALPCDMCRHGECAHRVNCSWSTNSPRALWRERLAGNSRPTSSFILNDRQDLGHGSAKHCERASAWGSLSAQIRKLAATALVRRPYFDGGADRRYKGALGIGEARAGGGTVRSLHNSLGRSLDSRGRRA